MSALDLFRLDGKVALVTGGGSGLGQGIALALAEAGADVVVVGRGNGLAETASQIRTLGRLASYVEADLSSTAPIPAIMDHVRHEMGALDILVNNAGIIRRTPALAVTEDDWDAVINVNQRSVFFLSQAAARVMAEQGGGKIINICSLLSFQGGVFVPAYAAAKSAMAGITRALANELAAQGINVNGIAPGYMETANTAPIRADAARKAAIEARIPAGRWGTAADLAGAAIYLASRASDYVHGHILCVDGGWMAR